MAGINTFPSKKPPGASWTIRRQRSCLQFPSIDGTKPGQSGQVGEILVQRPRTSPKVSPPDVAALSYPFGSYPRNELEGAVCGAIDVAILLGIDRIQALGDFVCLMLRDKIFKGRRVPPASGQADVPGHFGGINEFVWDRKRKLPPPQ